MLPVGWLCWDGVELVNHARTLTYLRLGLGGPEWEVKLRAGAVSTYDGYQDAYSDIYEAEFMSPYNLACYCAQTADLAGYVNPEADDAPWYVASKPQSAEFLGVLLDDLDDRPPTTRGLRRWATGGAGVTGFSPSERTAGFVATLVASTPAGMEWGRRWLTEVVSGGLCSDDDGSEVTFLPGCPDDDTDETSYRRYARVVLIDPPRFSTVADDVPECEVTEARWQIGAGVPWLLSVPDLVGAATTLLAGESASFPLSTDDWNGDVAGLLRIEASVHAASGITVAAYPVPEGEDCPIPGTPNPCHAFGIPTLAPYGVIEIDSAQEQATYYNPTSKQPEPAWGQVAFEGPWSWLTVPPCSTVCVTVTNGSTGAIEASLYEVAREA